MVRKLLEQKLNRLIFGHKMHKKFNKDNNYLNLLI